MDAIKKFLDYNARRKNIRVAVVGDLLVDEYYEVNADRVSPEFPIPVLKGDGVPSQVCLGGAGNVAAQFKHFNVDVNFIGFVDQESRNMLEANGLNTQFCVDLPEGRKVPRKKRYYQGEFPLCRLDVELPNYGMNSCVVKRRELDSSNGSWVTVDKRILLRELQEKLFNNYKRSENDVVIFSDYAKGVFNGEHGTSQWVNYENSAITIVDPKGPPVRRWRGCSIIKPNEKEARVLSGTVDVESQCEYFKRETGCTAVVITQGGNGVVGNVMGAQFEYRPNKRVVANSVIGAGDSFVAFLAMTMAHAMDIVEAVEVAFKAGAIYVQRKHNKPVSPLELLDPVSKKFIIPSNRDYKLVMTNGVFDCGLTSAHILYLQQAKAMGDKLLVALNSDESVKRIKGPKRPIMPLEERMKIVAGLECVDYVTSFDEDTPLELVKKIMPNLLVKGGDYKPEEVAGFGIVDIAIVNKFDTISTTDKIKKILEDT